MSMRTDLALESMQRAEASGKLPGIMKHEHRCRDAELTITEVDIDTPEASERIGRPIGRYITVSCMKGRLSDYCENAEQRALCLAREIKRAGELPERVLVAGLGNPSITPDSLGPRAAQGILATRHIKRLAKDLDTSELSEVTVIAAGVMAQTGMESQELIRSVCKESGAQLVIAVDALACAELPHLGSTIQICGTGISPGSGVENARAELSEATLGVPCIAIGVPTVTDCGVIAEISGGRADESYAGMIVTPKDIDQLIARSAQVIALGVNLALHPTLTPAELGMLMS